MKFKPGVVMWRMHPEIEAAVAKIDDAVKLASGSEATITSARDGEHSATSLHYHGRALDIRTRHVSDDVKGAMAQFIRDALGDDFDVVVESSHIHVEYDPD